MRPGCGARGLLGWGSVSADYEGYSLAMAGTSVRCMLSRSAPCCNTFSFSLPSCIPGPMMLSVPGAPGCMAIPRMHMKLSALGGSCIHLKPVRPLVVGVMPMLSPRLVIAVHMQESVHGPAIVC